MKRVFIILISLLAIACVICSCDNAGSGDNAPVKVSLGVEHAGMNLSRVLSVDGQSSGGAYTVKYKATPMWTSSNFSIKGATSGMEDADENGFVTVSMENGIASLGYLAQGKWQFEVKVIGTDATYVTENPIERYVNAITASDPIEVEVVLDSSSSATGTLKFQNISINDVVAGMSVKATYQKLGDVNYQTVFLQNDGTGKWGNLYVDIDIDPGYYIINVTRFNGAVAAGASTILASVYPEKTTTVSGSLDTNIWATAKFTFSGIEAISITAPGGETLGPTSGVSTPVTDGTNITIVTGTAAITQDDVPTGDTVIYKLMGLGTNSVMEITPVSGHYTLSTSGLAGAYGSNYTITLVAQNEDGTLAVSAGPWQIAVIP